LPVLPKARRVSFLFYFLLSISIAAVFTNVTTATYEKRISIPRQYLRRGYRGPSGIFVCSRCGPRRSRPTWRRSVVSVGKTGYISGTLMDATHTHTQKERKGEGERDREGTRTRLVAPGCEVDLYSTIGSSSRSCSSSSESAVEYKSAHATENICREKDRSAERERENARKNTHQTRITVSLFSSLPKTSC
jgi:hypothetical protein